MQARAILVTGGARRIGAAIAQCAHAAGANVAVHCHRSRAEAERLAEMLNAVRPGSCVVLHADLLDSQALPGLVDAAGDAFGRLDGLVNNASSFHATPMGAIGHEAWEDLMGTNARAPLLLAQAAAPRLKAARGAIVNVVDIHAQLPLAGFPVYTAAKAALAALTRALAIELAPEVRVNGVAPGAILWPEGGDAFPEAERSRILAQTPLARLGSPEDIAGAVKWLLFDAPFVTGQILAVDGGRSLRL